ncbi:low-specificity L-threonine aldolase [uncultured Arenimonas sp.]|uniref:low-specificity L-threonine aldolase n=1 Tax=uncultured Arenimonas sp. TaxID=546226 RepID=UPI0030D7BF01
MKWVDLRSDTVTQPTPAMRQAGLSAAVGDDVMGDDPSVNALQDRVARELGFESALYVPSGTQSNLLALMGHCERGDEYLVGMDAHTYKYEGGGAAVLGSIQPQPIVHAADGTLPIEALDAAVKPLGDPHFARTRLLALENTWHGRPLPLDYLAQAGAFARERGLAFHLDGARLYNAAVACGVPAAQIAGHFDSVSVCLSKGLGAPVGSVLAGSRALVDKARRWRKVLGGGWRQAGMMAAMAHHALDHHVARLADDHRRAGDLADALRSLGLAVDGAFTNILFVTVPDGRQAELAKALEARGVRISAGRGARVRLVTHLDIDDAGLERAITGFREFFA